MHQVISIGRAGSVNLNHMGVKLLRTPHFCPSRELWVGVSAYLAIIVLLVTVPYWIPTPPGIESAATALGYNNNIAYFLVLVLSILAIGISVRLSSKADSAKFPEQTYITQPLPARSHRKWLEIAVVAVTFIALYFPPFLARYGTFLEDNAFMTLLHRMQFGQVPYKDFEFLYGPLMIYGLHAWMQLFGFSLTSYYTLLALAEAGMFIFLVYFLRRYFPDLRQRFLAFILLSFLLFNTLLGFNWNGIRRLLPAMIVLILAGNPFQKGKILLTGALLGVLLAYSHDVGIACLAGVFSVYVLEGIVQRSWSRVLPGMALLAFSLMLWLLITWTIMRDDFSTYFHSIFWIMRRFSMGEQGFQFFWTVNALAVFALLCFGCIIVGRGLGERPSTLFLEGDYFLFMSLVYALFGLKSGLNRADMWHLDAPMLAPSIAFILPLPRMRFSLSMTEHRLSLSIIILMAATYFAALAPSGSYYAHGLFQGMRDVLSGRSTPSHLAEFRGATILFERSEQQPDLIALGRFLAQADQYVRPVVFYNRAWSLGKYIGVTTDIFPPDDFLPSDQAGMEIVDYLKSHRNALVVMWEPEYREVYGLFPSAHSASSPYFPDTPAKRVLSILSSVHFKAEEIEFKLKADRWKRTIGVYLCNEFRFLDQYGEFVLLERK